MNFIYRRPANNVLTLDQDATTSPVIEKGLYTSVTTNKPLTDGTFNTLWFPFDMSASEISSYLGENAEVYRLKDIRAKSNGGYDVEIIEDTKNGIKAYEPVFVKVDGGSEGININYYMQVDKTLSEVEPVVELENGWKMVGTTTYGTIPDGHYFIGTSNGVQKFYRSKGTSKLRAYRAYFVAPASETETETASSANLSYVLFDKEEVNDASEDKAIQPINFDERLFIVMGVFVIVFGVISLLSLNKKDDVAPSVRGSFWQQFVSVFNFKQFFQLKELVWVNVGVAVFFIGFNVYFAYIGNYLIYYLGYTADMMGVIEAVPLVLAMLTAIPIGVLINKNKHPYIALASILINIVGLMILFPVKAAGVDNTQIFNPILWLGIFVVGVGYVGILQTTKVWTKQLYPADAKGQFEGIWILFFVLIPMIGGSLIGQAVVKTSGEQFLNEASGQMEYIPNGNVFLVGAVVILLSVIPFLLAWKYHKQRRENEATNISLSGRSE